MGYLLPSRREAGNRWKSEAERGVALMLVLWVMTLLSVIVFEFCSTMRIEATIARNFKEGERSYYFAQAGISRAMVEIVKAKSAMKKFKGAKESMVKGEALEEEGEDEVEEWKPREEPYTFLFEEGECEVKISDEGSKINLNWVAKQAKANRKLLTDILEQSCDLEGEERDAIADSIIDWVDADHEHLMNGAEDDYYESLEDPYECRDGDFVVTEELLLVKGVTEEIFYGEKKSSEESQEEKEEKTYLHPSTQQAFPLMHKGMMKSGGLSDVFTVFSESTSFKINLNDAPYELLLSIPGMTSEVALEIIEERREEEFENISDARLKELPNYTQIAPYLTVDPTNFYRVEARGRIADGAVARAITAVIKYAPQEGKKFEILYWQEGV